MKKKLASLILFLLIAPQPALYASQLSWCDQIRTQFLSHLETADYLMEKYPHPSPQMKKAIVYYMMQGFKDTMQAYRTVEYQYGPTPAKKYAPNIILEKLPAQEEWAHTFQNALTHDIPLTFGPDLRNEIYAHFMYDKNVYEKLDEIRYQNNLNLPDEE